MTGAPTGFAIQGLSTEIYNFLNPSWKEPKGIDQIPVVATCQQSIFTKTVGESDCLSV